MLHMLGLIDLVLGLGIVKTRYRDSKFIHYVRVKTAVIAFPRIAFAPACKTNGGTVITTVVFFQLHAVSTPAFGFLGTVRTERASVVIFDTPSEAVAGHSHAT